jgi:hypothetical protein
MLATGRRRRLGAWLLAGWVAFWLTTVLQPCCSSFAAESGRDSPTPIAHADDSAVHLVELLPYPELPDTECQDLTSTGPGVTNAVVMVTDRPDFLMTAQSVPLLFKPYDDARALLTSNIPHPPPSGAPLYLRTQRFRI